MKHNRRGYVNMYVNFGSILWSDTSCQK